MYRVCYVLPTNSVWLLSIASQKFKQSIDPSSVHRSGLLGLTLQYKSISAKQKTRVQIQSDDIASMPSEFPENNLKIISNSFHFSVISKIIQYYIFCQNRIFFGLERAKLHAFIANTCQIPAKNLSKTLAVRFGMPAYAGITMPPTLVKSTHES